VTCELIVCLQLYS